VFGAAHNSREARAAQNFAQDNAALAAGQQKLRQRD